jgi:predicted unusual protein kinase regulating ubiquinone biosynthesis (AarF/ABC1/UbiB family)
MLRTKSTSSSTEVLLALIYGSGPFFQKYIQLLGDYLEPGNDPDLKALRENLKDVKSGLAHIKPYYLAKYTNEIEAQRGVRIHILKSLGAASVGETFLCTMQKRQSDGSFGPAQEVVVKFMRPDIEDVALREADFFQKTAGSISHMMGESFEGLKKQILDEMDYVKELDKLKRGYEVYNEPNSSIRVVRPIPDNAFPQTKYYMAMELALGKTFKDVRVKTLPSNSDQAFRAKVELMVKGVLLELLTNRYIDKAFFLTPDGFFHGDLHDGNILMIIDDKVFDILQKKVRQNGDFSREDVRKLLNVKGNNGQNLIKITLIDFGNAHSLTKKERSGMLNLFISCTPISQSIPAFMQAFDELSNLPIAADKIEIIKKDLEADAFNPEKAFEEVNGVKIKKRAHQRLGAAMDTLMANDIPIPASIMAFSRSLAMIDNSFKQLFEDVRMGQLKGFKDFNFNSSIEDIAIPQLAREFLLPDALAPESWQPDIGLSWENKKAIGKSSVDVIKYYLLNKNDTANNLE